MQTQLGTGTSHPNEIENRLEYAKRIIAWLDNNVSATTANLCVIDQRTWENICVNAGETHMPSKATISCIVGMFHMREQMAEKVARLLPDKPVMSRLVPAIDPEKDRI